jgi:predicted ribonuclease toxin of YeeF-YezG toxin-antitoxin module
MPVSFVIRLNFRVSGFQDSCDDARKANNTTLEKLDDATFEENQFKG